MKRSKYLLLIRELALEDSRKKHPGLPEKYRSIRTYTDRSANGLTMCIIDFLRFNGWQAERIPSSGRYVDGTRVVKDIIGRTYKIGSGKWIPGSGVKGTADISATIKGRSVKIEIKMQRPGYKDRQSEDQKAYQQSVEAAGGIYIIVSSLDEFMNFYQNFNIQLNEQSK